MLWLGSVIVIDVRVKRVDQGRKMESQREMRRDRDPKNEKVKEVCRRVCACVCVCVVMCGRKAKETEE